MVLLFFKSYPARVQGYLATDALVCEKSVNTVRIGLAP